MSELSLEITEIEDISEAISEDISEEVSIKPKVKVKKPRKPMSAEHKAKVVESLKKAREASKLARGKKSQVKKIKKMKADEETDDIIRNSLLEKSKKNDEKDLEIKRLMKKLENMTLQDVLPKPKREESVAVLEQVAKPSQKEEQPEARCLERSGKIIEQEQPEARCLERSGKIIEQVAEQNYIVPPPIIDDSKPTTIKRILRGKKIRSSRY